MDSTPLLNTIINQFFFRIDGKIVVIDNDDPAGVHQDL
jgi:hypothetical protein